MGSQRRLVDELAENYALTKADAWKWIPMVEATKLGDELEDAAYILTSGEWENGLAELRRLRDKLVDAVAALEHAGKICAMSQRGELRNAGN